MPAARTSKSSPRLSVEQRTAILKALADPTRYELFEKIVASSCPLSCSDAGTSLPIAPATLSHHIKELESAGLISIRRDGKFHLLSIRPETLDALLNTLKALESRSRCNA